MPQNFLRPQRDQPLLMPVDMREWLPEDDLVFVVLDAVATLDLGGFRRLYRADGHGRAAFDPEMMVALLLYGYCQGERSSRVIEKRCVRDVAYRVIAGGLRPDHATIARFRARHQEALGGLFSQVLRLLAAEGMVSLGLLSLDGTKLAGNAAQKANRTLPQIEKLLVEAAERDAADDARQAAGEAPAATPRALARRAGRRQRLAAARDRLAAEDTARRQAQRAKQEAWDAAAAAGKRRGGRRPGDEPRTNRAGTEPRANTTDPDCRVMRNQKGYVAALLWRPDHSCAASTPGPGRAQPERPRGRSRRIRERPGCTARRRRSRSRCGRRLSDSSAEIGDGGPELPRPAAQPTAPDDHEVLTGLRRSPEVIPPYVARALRVRSLLYSPTVTTLTAAM